LIDIIGEASNTVAEFIYRGRYIHWFRMSGQTSEGNVVDVWQEYMDVDGKQITEFRWRIWGNFDQVGEKRVVIAKGKVIEFSPQYREIISALEEQELMSQRSRALDKELEEIRQRDIILQNFIDRLDMGRIE
jgi:hypothetical protein